MSGTIQRRRSVAANETVKVSGIESDLAFTEEVKVDGGGIAELQGGKLTTSLDVSTKGPKSMRT